MSGCSTTVDCVFYAAVVLLAAAGAGCVGTHGTGAGLEANGASPRSRLRDIALVSRGATEIVRSLTDEVGPRPAGSLGYQAAVEWALRTLRERGFSNVRAEPVTVPHWERGEESGAVVSPVSQPLRLAALGGSIGTPPGGVTGEVVEVESLEAVDKLGRAAVAGKIVYYNVPTARARDGSGYGKAVAVRGAGAQRAAALGAVGVVIRSIGTDHNRLPHTGMMRREPNEPTVPAAALAVPDADLLHRLIEAHRPVALNLTLGCRWLADVESANVVGEIRGAVRPDEIVLLGAHLDSWDLGTGAIDDGAGVGIVVHAAQLLGSLPRPPERTVRVVLFANEEHGLSGGRAYALAHRAEAATHIAALEADAGTESGYALRFLGAPEAKGRMAEIAADLKSLGIDFVGDDAHGGADLGPLRALGVPMVDVAQDATTYFDYHHTANDTFDKINPQGLAQVTAAFAVIAHGIANLDGDLGRIPEQKREGTRRGPIKL